MDLYTVSKTTNLPEMLIETFTSCIWTERYAAYGDVQVTLIPTPELEAGLRPGVFLGFSETPTLMILESVTTKTEEDGRRMMTLEGTSLEGFLRHRAATRFLPEESWELSGTAASVITQMAQMVLVTGGIEQAYPFLKEDVFSNLTISNLAGSTPAVSKIAVKRKDLYTAIKEVADVYDLGFRFRIPTKGSTNKRFEVYKGVDRTGPSGVFFSTTTESLSQVKRLLTNANEKTTAYVFSTDLEAYAIGQTGAREWDRKIVMVDATDIPDPSSTIANDRVIPMTIRAFQVLTQARPVDMFDGEVNPESNLRFNRDYGLGDLTYLKSPGLTDQLMRVAEHIWVQDEQGERSYPTLTFA